LAEIRDNPKAPFIAQMPIDGLKEKLLAALRGGIKTVLIPEERQGSRRDPGKRQGRAQNHSGSTKRLRSRSFVRVGGTPVESLWY
jgi:Lon protease (S16) C-terminal proteolytic domain